MPPPPTLALLEAKLARTGLRARVLSLLTTKVALVAVALGALGALGALALGGGTFVAGPAETHLPVGNTASLSTGTTANETSLPGGTAPGTAKNVSPSTGSTAKAPDESPQGSVKRIMVVRLLARNQPLAHVMGHAGDAPIETDGEGCAPFEIPPGYGPRSGTVIYVHGFAAHSVGYWDGGDVTNVALEEGGEVTGRVFPPRDAGASVVTIEIAPVVESPTGWPVRSRVEISLDGTYRADFLPLGEHELVASFPGCPSVEARLTIVAGSNRGPDLVLGTGARVRGRVVSPEGNPIADGEIELENRYLSRVLARAQTRTDGGFELLGLAPGTYVLQAGSREPTRRVLVVEATDLDVGDVTALYAPRTREVTGQVVGPDGAPVAGAAAVRVVVQGSSRYDYNRTTDERGRFVFPVRYGQAVVWADKGALVAPLLALPADGPAEVTLTLAAASTLAGRVVLPEGQPSDEVSLEITMGLERRREPIAADGTFEVSGLLAGRHHVVVLTRRHAFERRGPETDVALAAGSSTHVDFSLASAHERVVVVVSGLPEGTVAESVTVRSGASIVSLDDPVSSIELDGVEPGTATVVVTVRSKAPDSPGHVLSTTVNVKEGEPAQVTLLWPSADTTGEIEGRVAADHAERGLRVHALGPGGAASAAVSVDGSFHLASLAPGRWRVVAALLDVSQPDFSGAVLVNVVAKETARGAAVPLAGPG